MLFVEQLIRDYMNKLSNKCCNSCKYDCMLSGNTPPTLRDRDKDYCTMWQQKEESEVETLSKQMFNDLMTGDVLDTGKQCRKVAKYILQNYLSKEKLERFVNKDSQYFRNTTDARKEIYKLLERETEVRDAN